MKVETKLTSVNIIEDVYKKFKLTSIEGKINLQKLVNRALDLYNNDESFRQKVDNHSNLTSSGSKF